MVEQRGKIQTNQEECHGIEQQGEEVEYGDLVSKCVAGSTRQTLILSRKKLSLPHKEINTNVKYDTTDYLQYHLS